MTIYDSPTVSPDGTWQAIVDAHPVALNGRCVECGTHGGCARRDRALRALAIGRNLPRRRPGATRPELIGARRVRT